MAVNILVFGMTNNPGGMESCIMNYFRNVSHEEIHFDFLCNWEHMIYETEVKEAGSKIYTIPQKSNSYSSYKKALKIFFESHAKEYDVIWYNTCTLTNIDYLIYAKKYGIKRRIIHAHNSGNETSFVRGLLHCFNKYRIALYATDFWSCSTAADHYFYNTNQLCSSKHKIIKNAIDTKKFQFNSSTRIKIRTELGIDDKFVIGHIGRFQYQKNHEFLIDVFNKFCKIHNDSYLLLIGQGENEKNIRTKVKSLGLDEKVLFLGARNDVNELLQAMDVFVFPSRFEGLGMVLIEAQTAGLECITTKDKVPEEVNVTGNVIFLPLETNPQKWADSINLRFIKDYDRSLSLPKVVSAGYDITKESCNFENYILGENNEENVDYWSK